MRVFVTAAFAALMLSGAAIHRVQADDPGHRFAPSLAQTYVAEIQRQLGQRGYFAGPATGQVTPETRAAVAAYQHDVGLPADGIADMAVINMLNFGPRISAAALPAVKASLPPPAPPAVLTPIPLPPQAVIPEAPPQAAIPQAPPNFHEPAPPSFHEPAPPAGATADDTPPPLAAPRPEVTARPLPPPSAPPPAAAPPPAEDGGLLPIRDHGPGLRAIQA